MKFKIRKFVSLALVATIGLASINAVPALAVDTYLHEKPQPVAAWGRGWASFTEASEGEQSSSPRDMYEIAFGSGADFVRQNSTPVNGTIVYDGIRMDLISTVRDPINIYLFLSVTDETGDRLSSDMFFADSTQLRSLFIRDIISPVFSGMRTLSYDESTKTAVTMASFKVFPLLTDDGDESEFNNVTFTLNGIFSGFQHDETILEDLDIHELVKSHKASFEENDLIGERAHFDIDSDMLVEDEYNVPISNVTTAISLNAPMASTFKSSSKMIYSDEIENTEQVENTEEIYSDEIINPAESMLIIDGDEIDFDIDKIPQTRLVRDEINIAIAPDLYITNIAHIDNRLHLQIKTVVENNDFPHIQSPSRISIRNSEGIWLPILSSFSSNEKNIDDDSVITSYEEMIFHAPDKEALKDFNFTVSSQGYANIVQGIWDIEFDLAPEIPSIEISESAEVTINDRTFHIENLSISPFDGISFTFEADDLDPEDFDIIFDKVDLQVTQLDGKTIPYIITSGSGSFDGVSVVSVNLAGNALDLKNLSAITLFGNTWEI